MIKINNVEQTLEELNQLGILAKLEDKSYMVSNRFLKALENNFTKLQKVKPDVTLNVTFFPTLDQFASNLTNDQKIQYYLVFEGIHQKAMKQGT